MRRLRLAIIAVVVAGTIIGTAAEAGATFPGTNGEIAYLYAGGKKGASLRTMAPDGSPVGVLWAPGEPIGVGTNQAGPYDVVWSPDGTAVAMVASGEVLGGDRLLMGDPTTGERHVILRISSFNEHAFFASIAFSPGGDRVLFCAVDIGLDGDALLYTVAVDGSDLTLVSDRTACLADWSSTDRIVAVVGRRFNKIATMDPDGSNRSVVVPAPLEPASFPFGQSLSWSPDGSRFAYPLRAGSRLHYDLFSVDAGGGARVRLTHTPRRDELFPVFSPEGSEVVFSRSREFRRRQSDLFIVAADGSSERRLTDTPRRHEFSRSWRALP